MGVSKQGRCKQEVTKIRKAITNRLKVLDEQLNKAQDDQENCHCFREYTLAMTDLVFDVIEHAVFYADKAEELEAFSHRLQHADHALNTAIGILKSSENKHIDWHIEFEKEMHSHDEGTLLDSLRIN